MATNQLLGELLVQDGSISEEQLNEALKIQATSNKRLGEIILEKGFTSQARLQEALDKANQRLGDILVRENTITKEQLRQALQLQVGTSRRLGEILVKKNFISEDQLQQALAKHLGIPLVTIKDEFNEEIKSILPRYLCKKYNAVPLNLKDKERTLKVAMIDPSDREAIEDIEKYTDKFVVPVLALRSDLKNSFPKVPFSHRDIMNARVTAKIPAALSLLVLVLVVALGIQFYKYRALVEYGTYSKTAQASKFKNLELIITYFNSGKVELLGHGDYASGNFDVEFDTVESFKKFIDAKERDFSSKQQEWISWTITQAPVSGDRKQTLASAK